MPSPRKHTPPPSYGPNRQKQISVAMDRETIVAIDDAADAEGVTRSEWVRLRLEWALMDVQP